MTMRYNPFEELERVFDRMGRQFSEVSRSWESGETFGQWPLGGESMPVDLVDRDDSLVATVDLPGFDRDEVDIRVSDRTLRIAAEREERLEESAEQFVRRERQHRSLRRSIELPDEVESDAVTATMKNGILTITMPKTAVETARSVEISVE